MRLILITALCAALAAPVAAKPPLRDVSEIDDTLMEMGIADEIRKQCSGINARMLKAYGMISSLKQKALDLGYSRQEVEDYVTSKAEKRRMRAKASAYLAERGVDAENTSQLCRFGRDEMARGTTIGSLLR